MVNLYNVDSPINREQRNNLNATFRDIQTRFSNLTLQISLLSGGTDLEEIIQRIQDAMVSVENTEQQSQQALTNISNALNELQNALDNSQTATDGANQAILDLQSAVNELGEGGSYDNLRTYQRNNIVEYNGSSYIAITETTGNLPPTLPLKNNQYWQLLAQRGVDGNGSVSSVNNTSPDINGNIDLSPSIIGATSETDFQVLNQEFTSLNSKYDNNFSRFINVKDYGALGDGVTDDTQSFLNAFNEQQTNGGTIVIPGGVYRVNQGFAFDNTLHMLGLNSPTIQPTDTFTTNTLGVFRINGDGSTVKGINLNGNGDNLTSSNFGFISYAASDLVFENVNCIRTTGIGIGFSNCRNVLVRDCSVRRTTNNSAGFWADADLGGEYNFANITFENCISEFNELDGFLINVNNVKVLNCKGNNNGIGSNFEGALGAGGIYSDKLLQNVVIKNSDFNTNTEFGINLAIVNGTISGCLAENNALSGIRIANGSNRMQVSNCIIRGNGTNPTTDNPDIWGKAGIQFSGVTFIVINACNIYDNNSFGIQSLGTEASNGIVIVGNNLKYNITDDANIGTSYPSSNVTNLVMESNF